MNALLNVFTDYIKDHIWLTVIVAVALVMIIVLVILLIQEIRNKKKKNREAEEKAEKAAEAPAPQPIAVVPVVAEPLPQPIVTTVDNPEQTEEIKEEEPVKKPDKNDKKPVAAPAKKPAAKKDPVAATGKWVIYEEDRGGYGFRLLASNGEKMLGSSSPYSSLSSAKSGIKTYQDNIAAGRLEIVATKSGSYFVQILNGSKRLLATSADYKTRASCENAMESIKRWASSDNIVVEESEDDDKK